MSLDQILKDVQEKFSCRKTVTIRGIEFVIGILDYDENQKVSSLPDDDVDPMVYMNDIRRQTLAYAIKSINGEEIPDVVQIGEGESKEKAIFIKEFLGRFPMKLTDQLFDAYVDVKEQSDKEIETEMQFEWFKTPEQRQKEREEEEKDIAETAKNESEQQVQEDIERTKENRTGTGDKPEEEIKLRKIEEPEEEKKDGRQGSV